MVDMSYSPTRWTSCSIKQMFEASGLTERDDSLQVVQQKTSLVMAHGRDVLNSTTEECARQEKQDRQSRAKSYARWRLLAAVRSLYRYGPSMLICLY